MSFLKKIFTWSFPAADKPKGDFDRKESACYLTGMLGQNIIYGIISAALMVYYTDVAHVSAYWVGVVFAVCRVWDAINDPIMGVIMEKTKSKYGKCRPWLKYVPFPIAVVTILLFIPMSTWPMAGRIAFLFIMYFMWSPFYTMGDIPLWSLPSRMIPEEDKRTKLISAARIIGGLGAVVVAIYAPIKNALGEINLGIFPNTGRANYVGYFNEEQGYFLTSLILCLFGAFLFKFIFPNVRERVTSCDTQPVTFKSSFALIKKNKPFIRVVISGILGCTKALILTAGIYFCKWVLGNGYEGAWVVIVGAPFLVGTLISYALTPSLGKKFTKKRLYLWSSYLSAIPVLILFFVGFRQLSNLTSPGLLAVMMIMLGIYGFFSGFTGTLGTVMIADSVDYLEWKEGVRGDGVFFSGLTFIAKLTSGIAILVSNILLGAVNYTPVIDDLSEKIRIAADSGTIYKLDFAATYPQISMMMLILITIIPAAGCILQAVSMHGYEITDEILKTARAANEEKHRLLAEEAALGVETEVSDQTDSEAEDVSGQTDSAETEENGDQ